MAETQWGKMIELLLGDENPCRICAVQVMCNKSFRGSGGGCPELKEKLTKALDETVEKNENKN